MANRKMKKYSDNEAGIFLRPMTGQDTMLIVEWRNNDAVRRNFIYQKPFTREGHEEWVRTMVETGKAVQMMICTLEEEKPLGSVYIRDIDATHRKGEYGIFIGEYRGRGIGTKAAELMIRFSFEELLLHRIFLRVFAENKRAIRSYEKAGFEREGLLREDVLIDGVYRDIVLMGILNRS